MSLILNLPIIILILTPKTRFFKNQKSPVSKRKQAIFLVKFMIQRASPAKGAFSDVSVDPADGDFARADVADRSIDIGPDQELSPVTYAQCCAGKGTAGIQDVNGAAPVDEAFLVGHAGELHVSEAHIGEPGAIELRLLAPVVFDGGPGLEAERIPRQGHPALAQRHNRQRPFPDPLQAAAELADPKSGQDCRHDSGLCLGNP